jgi:CRP/FNR family transcriptional regulator, dissimilatory nitrate respiration regulator
MGRISHAIENRTYLVSPNDWISPKVRAAAIERRLQPGQALFHSGSKTVGLYEVLKGTVRLVRTDRSGREAVLQTASAGDILAEASLFSPTYHCDAIATDTATVRLYPKAVVLAELQRDPKIAQAFAGMLARQVMALRTRLEQRNIHSARDRVRHFLAVNADPDGRTVSLSGTLKDIAAELGLTHEALYRTLADMVADGEIERRKGTIRLLKSGI